MPYSALIRRTKLHRPPLAPDVIPRPHLFARLDRGRDLPLALVSAPAGYGKSTLVASWLEGCDCQSAWLSLDGTDNDLGLFAAYIVAAVQTRYPDACQATFGLLRAGEQPNPGALADCLSNDLDELPDALVLALDDYQTIHDAAVHNLVDQLVLYPPERFRLIVMSRSDPPLSLGRLRAQSRMVEVRIGELQFERDETAAFVQRVSGHDLDAATVDHLHEVTEGWPVGLHLAALAMRHHAEPAEFLRDFDGGTHYLRDYLVEDVLSHQEPAARDCLVEISILDSFCQALCTAVHADGGAARPTDLLGTTLRGLLADSGLPCVALDERHEWYRYHHLVQDVLDRQLEARRSPQEIARLHQRAAEWYEANGLIEEALGHALKSDSPHAAGNLIVRHRDEILNGEQWRRLERWLRWLPKETVEGDPDLLLLTAWQLTNRGRHAKAFQILPRIEELLSGLPPDVAARPRGGIDALRSYQMFVYEKRPGEAIEYARRALAGLPADALSERGWSVMMLAGALQMSGDLAGAREAIYEALAGASGTGSTFQARLYSTLCFVNWMAADLPTVKRAALQYAATGETLGLSESAQVGRYFVGITHYEEDDLAAAEAQLVRAVDGDRIVNADWYAQAAFALASVYQARGRTEEARSLAARVSAYMLRTGNAAQLVRATAFEAELALRRGSLAEAVKWARNYEPDGFTAMYRAQEPPLTLAKTLVRANNPESRARAGDLLTRLHGFTTQTHNVRYLIEVLGLRALLQAAGGDEAAALEDLARAVSLARPGGLVRAFADLGPGLVPLLNRLEVPGETLPYVGRILTAFGDDPEAATEDVSAEAVCRERARRRSAKHLLTDRELEVLALLSRRLSNKEIAARLYITPGTVKRHASTLYSKLGVHDRRSAVAKATGLGLLTAPDHRLQGSPPPPVP